MKAHLIHHPYLNNAHKKALSKLYGTGWGSDRTWCYSIRIWGLGDYDILQGPCNHQSLKSTLVHHPAGSPTCSIHTCISGTLAWKYSPHTFQQDPLIFPASKANFTFPLRLILAPPHCLGYNVPVSFLPLVLLQPAPPSSILEALQNILAHTLTGLSQNPGLDSSWQTKSEQQQNKNHLYTAKLRSWLSQCEVMTCAKHGAGC